MSHGKIIKTFERSLKVTTILKIAEYMLF